MAVIDLPGRLGVLCDKLSQYGFEFESMLLNNTLFCYYTAFQSKAVIEYTRCWAKNAENKAAHMKLGIMASDISLPKHLKYCPLCVNEDISKFGESYWHRTQQTPGVFICMIHGCRLIDSDVLYSCNRTNEFFAVSLFTQETVTNINGLTEKEYKRALQFSIDVQWLYDNYNEVNNAYQNKGDFRFVYLKLLSEKGLATSSGRLYISEFINSFKAFYGEELLCIWQSNIDYSEPNNWLISICRKNRKSFHPIRHILLAQFLCGSLQSFFEKVKNMCNLSVQHKKSNTNIKTYPESSYQINRKKWLDACIQMPTFFKTQIRKVIPDIYAWLYRHDNEWLINNSPIKVKKDPKNNRVNWNMRDTEILNSAKKSVESLLKSKDKPERISISRTGKMIGYSGLFDKHLDKLPQTKKYLCSIADTPDSYRLKKIRWAIDEIESSGEQASMWKVMRKATIRDEMWSKYWNEVKKRILQWI